MQDFVEIVEGAVRRYCETLQRDGLSPSMTYLAHDREGKLYRRTEQLRRTLVPSDQEPQVHGPFDAPTAVRWASSPGIPTQHVPSTSNQNSGLACSRLGGSASLGGLSQIGSSTQGISGPGTAQTFGHSSLNGRYLLLCGDKTRSKMLDVRQEALQGVACDRSFSNLMRTVFTSITQLRGDAREILSFRKLEEVKAVQFQLHYGDIGRVICYDSVPPVDNDEYEYVPTELFPPIDGVYLQHRKSNFLS